MAFDLSPPHASPRTEQARLGRGTVTESGRRPAEAEASQDAAQDQVKLSDDAQKAVDKLQATDREVRAHEAAHLGAGAGIVRGGATYTYQRGPDGQMYAVGGEVSIDTSPVPDNPAATLLKAQQIRAAAMAPADPSGQDRSVAAAAGSMAARASAELAKGRAQGTRVNVVA